MVGYDIYKTFEDLFLPVEKRHNMVQEGIQSEDLCKIRSNSGDKKTSGVDAKKKVERDIRKQVLHQARPPDRDRPRHFLPPGPVQRPHLRSDARLCCTGGQRLRSHQAEIQADQHPARVRNDTQYVSRIRGTQRVSGQQRVRLRPRDVPQNHELEKDTDSWLNIKVDTQKWSLKGILLLFVEPYAAGARDSEKYIFPQHHQSQHHHQRLAKHAV